jgi:hypothetical protein
MARTGERYATARLHVWRQATPTSQPAGGVMQPSIQMSEQAIRALRVCGERGGRAGPEQLALAVLEVDDGLAVRILARLGVGPEQLQSRFRAVSTPAGPGRVSSFGMARILERAYHECEVAGADALGTDHILLGIVADGGSGAAEALAALGVTEESLQRALAELGAADGPEPASPSRDERWAFRSELRGLAAMVERMDEFDAQVTAALLLSRLDAKRRPPAAVVRLIAEVEALQEPRVAARDAHDAAETERRLLAELRELLRAWAGGL